MHIITWKTYFTISIGVGLVILIVGLLFGKTIAAYATSLPNAAVGPWRTLASILLEPIRFAMLNPVIGALVFGLLWPITGVLIFTTLLIVLLVAASGVMVQIDTQTPLQVK